MLNGIDKRFKEILPPVDYASLRLMTERSEFINVRQGILQPIERNEDSGAMLTVINKKGMGYAATCDLSNSGLKKAVNQAKQWADYGSSHSVVDFSQLDLNAPVGEYQSQIIKPWNSISTKDKVDMLTKECQRLKLDDKIVDWMTFLWNREIEITLITSNGGNVKQLINLIVPFMRVTASEGSDAIQRSSGTRGGRQAGLEVLDEIGFYDMAPVISSEALELLQAPNCPSDKMDLILDADQMILQIHESIGHPLELDRILGDERNYAGTSFVTPDMFGQYQYGSELLNISFNPSLAGEFAAYAFDDDGQPTKHEMIIEKGILKRGLGSITSQKRSGLLGVSSSRATSWNRQPIDRMANLNLETGDHSLNEMIAAVDKGIFMKNNISWSIDDSRNKFQFGCEWGRLIENGKLSNIVKKTNYRGISATFWRNLKMVGSKDTFEIMGTPNCGKGEPNQAIWVGHASPACLFTDVDVFGGE